MMYIIFIINHIHRLTNESKILILLIIMTEGCSLYEQVTTCIGII